MAKQPPVTCEQHRYFQSPMTMDSVISDSDYEITAEKQQLCLGPPSLTCKRQNAKKVKKVYFIYTKKANDIQYLQCFCVCTGNNSPRRKKVKVKEKVHGAKLFLLITGIRFSRGWSQKKLKKRSIFILNSCKTTAAVI